MSERSMVGCSEEQACFCLGSRWVLHFMPDYKSFVSFYLVPIRVQHMPFGAEVFSYDALHLKKALRVFG